MCGICGYTGAGHPGLVDEMIADLRMRGPDGAGHHDSGPIHLGHTRLAIVDIAGGGQPMTRSEGRYTVSCNGEIYNYAALRADLEKQGQIFSTTCDTELIPLGFAVHGEDFFSRLDGMFAIALVDNLTHTLHLARDHLGIKPLYYARTGSDLVFASSARAVTRHPAVTRRLSSDAVQELLMFRYVRSGRSLFRDIQSLSPGSLLTWHAGRLTERSFWVPRRRGAGGTAPATAIADRVQATLRDTVRRQLRADVPVGLFLSGGVDSATIAHYARQHATGLTAFTFSTGGPDDETEVARALAGHFGLRHRVITMNGRDFESMPDIIAAMDNPVGDPIVIPTYMLCGAAAREVKVVLTGEGADEMFGGYAHFPVLRRLGRLARTMPALRHLGALVRHTPVWALDRMFDYPASLGTLGREAAARLIEALGDSGRLLRTAMAVMDDEEIARATTLGRSPPAPPADLSFAGLLFDFLRTWLPNQILHKMDQLSMAHGLEARVPFVDVGLYDTLIEAPDALMAQGGKNKTILREIAAREGVPVARRPKVPFHLPVEQLWREPFGRLCDEWLSETLIRRHGIIRSDYVRQCRIELERGEFLASKRLAVMASLHMWVESRQATL